MEIASGTSRGDLNRSGETTNAAMASAVKAEPARVADLKGFQTREAISAVQLNAVKLLSAAKASETSASAALAVNRAAAAGCKIGDTAREVRVKAIRVVAEAAMEVWRTKVLKTKVMASARNGSVAKAVHAVRAARIGKIADSKAVVIKTKSSRAIKTADHPVPVTSKANVTASMKTKTTVADRAVDVRSTEDNLESSNPVVATGTKNEVSSRRKTGAAEIKAASMNRAEAEAGVSRNAIKAGIPVHRSVDVLPNNLAGHASVSKETRDSKELHHRGVAARRNIPTLIGEIPNNVISVATPLFAAGRKLPAAVFNQQQTRKAT
jgi:hypothetical protein